MKFRDYFNESVKYPHGVYVSVKLDQATTKIVSDYQEKYLKKLDINQELHCTLIYSKQECSENILTSKNDYSASFKKFEMFGDDKDMLVMRLESPELLQRNKELTEKYNFISDYVYHPHITLSYNANGFDISKLPPIRGKFKLIDETASDLDEDWSK